MPRPALPLLRARAAEFLALALILIVAAAARLWYVGAGIPYAVGIDEPQVIDRALRILNTGDWNTHLFDYPSLVIYLHAWVAIGRFLLGAVSGEWNSLAGFDIASLLRASRVVAALIGVATVWLTYRTGVELGSRRVALVAAALAAVRSSQVREAHFVLTDIPVTALTTLTVLLSIRAGRRRTLGAYAWAGIAAGLAAAAKYNGAVAVVAIATAWLLEERPASAEGFGVASRWRTLAVAAAAAAAAFLLAAPYTVLDLPAFLNGFGAQLARFSGARATAEPAWLTYLKHMSLAGRVWVPAALAGFACVLVRRPERRRWMPVIVFTAAYFYVLSTHQPVFARYALPLSPMLCLGAGVVLVELARLSRRIPALDGVRANGAVLVALTLALVSTSAVTTVSWLHQYGKPDTRQMAAEWMASNLEKGSAVAVENSGPTYLNAAGFRVLGTELLVDHGVDWYQQRVRYLVISSPDLDRYASYLGAGTTVYQVAPTPQRWGPPIRIVKLQ